MGATVSVGRLVNTTPRVSVLIPTYRTVEFISETLDSVLAQTFESYEIIVINDGCPETPRLECVLAPYRDRITYVRQENRGLAGARNMGIAIARGEFLAFLDSDDIWEPEYLEIQVACLDARPDLDVIYPDATLFGDPSVDGRRAMELSPSHGEVTFESLVSRRCNVRVYALVRREAVLEVGGFDETLRSSEDFDLWIRMVSGGRRIGYHRRPLVRYRVREGSLSSDPLWMCEHVAAVLDKAARSHALTATQRAVLTKERGIIDGHIRLLEAKRHLFRRDYRGALQGFTDANRILRRWKLSLVIVGLRTAPGLLFRACQMRDRWVLRGNTQL